MSFPYYSVYKSKKISKNKTKQKDILVMQTKIHQDNERKTYFVVVVRNKFLILHSMNLVDRYH